MTIYFVMMVMTEKPGSGGRNAFVNAFAVVWVAGGCMYWAMLWPPQTAWHDFEPRYNAMSEIERCFFCAGVQFS
jgi:hypothetical protein